MTQQNGHHGYKITFREALGSPLKSGDEARLRREALMEDLLPDEQDDDVLGKVYDGRLVRRLVDFNLPYLNRIIAAVVMMIISAVASVAGPWIIGKAIDQGITARDMQALRIWSLAFLAIALLEWITNRYRIRMMAYVGTKVVADVRSQLFRHLHALTLNFHNNYSVGRLMSRLIGDVGVMQEFITWSITGLARAVFVLIAIFIAMLSLNWQLTLVTFLVMPLMVVLTNYWRKQVRAVYR